MLVFSMKAALVLQSNEIICTQFARDLRFIMI
jgi:hypothetical protein